MASPSSASAWSWSIADLYRYASSLRDPRTEGWGGVADTKFVLPLLLGYVYFAKVAGPRWMKGRQPFDLRWAVLTYNALNVVANAYFAVRVFQSTYLGGRYSFLCQGINYHSPTAADMDILSLGWWYSLIRIADFVDTVFFVLRKKFSQVSFLHLVHHFLVVLSAWFYMHFGADGQPMLGLCVNAFVHVVMYSYYFLAALGPSVRKHLWWKRYITQLQIAQFVGLMSHMAITFFYDCGYPRPLAVIALLQGSFVLALFVNFYVSCYVRRNKAKIRGDGTSKRD
ncbi:hypothetical protein HPB48_025443 [Haemaphysalis longicornis]|uniref:Elongation of very long chain fatty acids protein n=1 Tax=Haemaphysalis longicornis TaxID=44386 RepID=A0A9J6HA94_HAELO|nr:hypothetical protein HPB48_025443 [Haemaphysalis longicornis]